MKNILVLVLFFSSLHISFAKSSNYAYKAALIIDNHAYGANSALPDNSANISDLKGVLSHFGFEVKLISNVEYGDLSYVVEDFYARLPSESISLLYYGGHIFAEDEQHADLIPVNVELGKNSPGLLSVQKIVEFSNEENGNRIHDFLLFDTFFTSKNNGKKPIDIVSELELNQGISISFHDAKSQNVVGQTSNYIPDLINELFKDQTIQKTFEQIDILTESSSIVKNTMHNRAIFEEEHQISAIMVAEGFDMPSFPFPPPKASANYTFDQHLFSGINNLTESSERIENALKKSGYYEKSYYQIPNGYALVTRIEKMEPDGTPAAEGERWTVGDTGSSGSFDLLSYFKSLFYANDGHYRIIVFLVTSDDVQMTNKIMLMSEGQDFLSSGLNRLPSEFDSMPFTENHYCTALIYEWYKIEHEEAKFMQPSKFLGQYHLAKNKFVEYLEAEK